MASSRNFITMLLLQQRNIFNTFLYLVFVLIGNLIALLITHFFPLGTLLAQKLIIQGFNPTKLCSYSYSCCIIAWVFETYENNLTVSSIKLQSLTGETRLIVCSRLKKVWKDRLLGVNFTSRFYERRSQMRKKDCQVKQLFCAYGICACKS